MPVLEELRIMVVDDQFASRQTIRAMLRMFGVTQTFEAASVADARAFLTDARDMVDVVITDIVMPGEDGLDLFKMCKENYPDLPVLVLSGAVDHKTVSRAKDLGVRAFLAKPFSGAQLQNKLSALINSSN